LFVGLSVVYFFCLLFALYQNYEDVAETMYWMYPELRDWKPDEKVRSLCRRDDWKGDK